MMSIRGIILRAVVVYLVAVSKLNAQTATLQPFPVGDQRNCLTGAAVDSEVPNTLVLPGFGFDNLRNKDLALLFVHNYSMCRTTDDRKFLIPNDVFVIPRKETNLNLFSEYFEHWDNYSSLTASSINIGVGFLGLGGKYSERYREVKIHQVHDQSTTTRAHFRNRAYTITIDPATQLHPTFKSMVYRIASYLQSNQTELADYCAELLVRDYGTHYVNTIDVGAVFAKVDHISKHYAKNTRRQSLIYSASVDLPVFKLFVNLGFSSNQSENDTRGYKQNQVASSLFTIGGPPFTPDFNISLWQEQVINNLAIVDRRGKPLHHAVTPAAFPELSDVLVWTVSDTVQDAVSRYVKLNTVKGCTDPSATNFDFQANLDDGSCNVYQAPTHYTFGGMYQRCVRSGSESDLCRMYNQINPIVGDYACPHGYTPVLLLAGITVRMNVVSSLGRSCSGWIFRRCRSETRYSNRVSYANNSAFWCVPLQRPEVNRELLFGGFFTRDDVNPFTGDQSCPNHFIELRLGETTVVCISSDYELGTVSSIKFGGFYSCRSGNPLATVNSSRSDPSSWPHSCPDGYAQHLISIEYNCAFTVCLEVGAFRSKQLLNARLPPFRSRPSLDEYGGEERGLIVQGSRDNLLIKETDGNWILVKRYSAKATEYLLSISNNYTDTEGDSESDVPSTESTTSSSSTTTWNTDAIDTTSTTIADTTNTQGFDQTTTPGTTGMSTSQTQDSVTTSSTTDAIASTSQSGNAAKNESRKGGSIISSATAALAVSLGTLFITIVAIAVTCLVTYNKFKGQSRSHSRDGYLLKEN